MVMLSEHANLASLPVDPTEGSNSTALFPSTTTEISTPLPTMDYQGDTEMDSVPAQSISTPIATLAESANTALQSTQNSTSNALNNLQSPNQDIEQDEKNKETQPPAKTYISKNNVPSRVIVIDISSDDDIPVKPGQGAKRQGQVGFKTLTKAQKKARNRLAEQQTGMRLRSAGPTAVISQRPLPAAPPVRNNFERPQSQQVEMQKNHRASFDAYRDPTAVGYSCYLPFATQHSILQTVQTQLEECLFEFAKAKVPNALTAAGWCNHLAGELNLWWPVFRNVMAGLPKDAIDHSQLESPIGNLFGRIKHIRHITVHRHQELPISSVEWMIKDAASLALALGDNDRGSRLLDLYRRVKDVCSSADSAREPTAELREQLKAGGEEILMLETQRAQIDQRLAVLRGERLTFLKSQEGTAQIGNELLGPLQDLDSFMK